MNKNVVMGLFIAVALAQIAVPVSMIVPREAALRTGTQYKFRCVPVDPFDAFRGRYVALRIESNSAPAPTTFRVDPGETVYATIENDAQGFARFSEIHLNRPADGDYLKLVVDRSRGSEVTFVNPFDRYYMPEDLAPAAERAYRSANSGSSASAYITVRVRNGLGVIENLYLDDMAVREYLSVKDQDIP